MCRETVILCVVGLVVIGAIVSALGPFFGVIFLFFLPFVAVGVLDRLNGKK